jgi:hypothetical protein
MPPRKAANKRLGAKHPKKNGFPHHRGGSGKGAASNGRETGGVDSSFVGDGATAADRVPSALDYAITRPLSRRRKRSLGSTGSDTSKNKRGVSVGSESDPLGSSNNDPPSPHQFISLEDIFWGKKKQQRRPKVKPNNNIVNDVEAPTGQKHDQTTKDTNNKCISSTKSKNKGKAKKFEVQYSKSYLELYTRDLSKHECHNMETQLRRQNGKNGRVLPHTTLVWNVLPSRSRKNKNEITSDSDEHAAIWRKDCYDNEKNISSWGKRKPVWLPLRYHHFYDSGDYANVAKSTSTVIPNSANISSNVAHIDRDLEESDRCSIDILKRMAAVDCKMPSSRESNSADALSGEDDTRPAKLTDEEEKKDLFKVKPDDHPGKKDCSLPLTESKVNAERASNLARHQRLELCPPGLAPVPRECTVLTHSPRSSCFALGDSAGYITLYNSNTLTSIARLETTASEAHHRTFRGSDDGETTQNPVQSDAPLHGDNSETLARKVPSHASLFRKATCDYKDRKDPTNVTARSPFSIESLCFTPIRRKSPMKESGDDAGDIDTFVEGIVYAIKDAIELLYIPEDGACVPLWRIDMLAYRSHLEPTQPSVSSFVPSVLKMEACQITGSLCIGFQEYFGPSPLLVVEAASAPTQEINPTPSTVPPQMCHIQPIVQSGNDHSMSQVLLGPRSCGIWSLAHPAHLIAVITTKHGNEDGHKDNGKISNSSIVQELVVLKTSSPLCSESRIVSRAILPTRKRAGNTLITGSLCQSRTDGRLVAVASTGGGIRVYSLKKSQQLSLLGVYGEGMKMHGHTVVWHQVMLHYAEDHVEQEAHNDDLALRFEKVGDVSKRHSPRILVVGLSHPFQEPKDSRDTIYMWDISDHIPEQAHTSNEALEEKEESTMMLSSQSGGDVADVPKVNMALPTFTIAAPSKSCLPAGNQGHKAIQGIQSLVILTSPRDQNCFQCPKSFRMIMTTHGAGECFLLEREYHSMWAGCMYDPEYVCVENTVDYIEDEDEVDFNIDLYREIMMKARQEEENRVAVAGVSCQEDSTAETEGTSDRIVNYVDVRDSAAASIPKGDEISTIYKCEPEWFLPRTTILPGTTTDYDGLATTEMGKSGAFRSLSTLSALLPEVSADSFKRKRPGMVRPDSPSSATSTSRAGGVRARQSISTILGSAVQKYLQDRMTNAEQRWCDRPDLQQGNGQNSVVANCLACDGRMSIHSCGARLIPQDTEAMMRAQEKQERQAAEMEKKAKTEKRKEAERKRRQERRDLKLREKLELQQWQEALRREEAKLALEQQQVDTRSETPAAGMMYGEDEGEASDQEVEPDDSRRFSEEKPLPALDEYAGHHHTSNINLYNEEHGQPPMSGSSSNKFAFNDDNSAAAADLIALSQGFNPDATQHFRSEPATATSFRSSDNPSVNTSHGYEAFAHHRPGVPGQHISTNLAAMNEEEHPQNHWANDQAVVSDLPILSHAGYETRPLLQERVHPGYMHYSMNLPDNSVSHMGKAASSLSVIYDPSTRHDVIRAAAEGPSYDSIAPTARRMDISVQDLTNHTRLEALSYPGVTMSAHSDGTMASGRPILQDPATSSASQLPASRAFHSFM